MCKAEVLVHFHALSTYFMADFTRLVIYSLLELLRNVIWGDDLIFIDVKTASVGEMSRKIAFEKSIAKMVKDMDLKKEIVPNDVNDDEEKKKIIGMLKEHPSLGLGENNAVEEEDGPGLAEAEKIKDIWGVQLKKRTKNKKGEEFLLVDEKTNAICEVSRFSSIEKGAITVDKDENGKQRILEAVNDQEVKEDLLEVVKQVMFNLEVVEESKED